MPATTTKRRPKRELMPRKRALVGEFLNELGALMYAEAWKPAYIKFLYLDEIRSIPEEGGSESLSVFSQLLDAIRVGIAQTEVDVTAYAISLLYPLEMTALPPALSVEDDGFTDGDSLFDMPVEFGKRLDQSPSSGFYSIEPRYWNEKFSPDDIDWKRSTISLSGGDIQFFPNEWEPKQPKDGVVIEAPLYIAQPNRVLARALHVPPLPSPESVKRYRQTQRNIWLEVTAATWRFLAIEPPDGSHGSQAELILKVRDYMRLNQLDTGNDEIGVAQKTVTAVISKIYAQWQEKNTKDSVLVSSTANIAPTGRGKS